MTMMIMKMMMMIQYVSQIKYSCYVPTCIETLPQTSDSDDHNHAFD
jgi:hypothetical protein